mmetsp:Transcript_4213/g.7152  ORF Transcript_4213/g.7152 Transcript_4213/m.7152 type:complete len:198 (-) Transcript_4213:44-637(-)
MMQVVGNFVMGTNVREPARVTHNDKNFYDYSIKDIDGVKYDKIGDLLKGSAATLVVTMNFDWVLPGVEDQMKELVKLHKKMGDKKVQVLGIPTSVAGIPSFISNIAPADVKGTMEKKGITFPVMDFMAINGPMRADCISYLRDYSDLEGNFVLLDYSKFIVDRDGYVVAVYGPQRSFADIERDLEKVSREKSVRMTF